MSTNRFLAGEFEPVRAEYTEHDLAVTGTLPDWLDGRYLRNGPNPIADVDPDTYNWFTGDGMVHGIRLAGGEALWYRNRWVDSESTQRRLNRQAPDVAGRSIMRGIGANTNVIGFGGRTLALVEAGLPCAELSDELETLDVWDFDGTVRGGYTAHPLEDPVTCELHAVSYHFGMGDKVRYSVIGTDGRLRRHVDITVGGSPMMHAFSLTESTVVVYDLPVTFDAEAATTATVPRGVRPLARLAMSALVGRVPTPHAIASRLPPGRPGALPYRWDPDYRARVGLMPREGDDADVVWIDVDPCYVYHPLNAHDVVGGVVVDLVVHDRTFDRDRTGPSEGRQHLERWTIDRERRTCRRERLWDAAVEFPRMDDRFTGRAHDSGWLVGSEDGGMFGSLLARVAASGGGPVVRRFADGVTLGEFTFVPRADDAVQGDGAVVGFVTDLAANSTSLAVLDAQTLEDIASVRLPHRVPAGFHGNWLPTTSQ
ncbi:carotenoid oxygenase family protein [Gordonia neofelifaecis]|uniref:Dioxygenase n=1 Tax=Gordonia neofelifaecis NRRL B-59395 TaxID=644548 RepID=F1YMZ0_9ACTN|nr:carotenoid oxygenase family protein [Gordonia neofelifaecis]EGD53877.1 carotenoid oxygenase [Gordonia neofelifaecis NRRL B-59395]